MNFRLGLLAISLGLITGQAHSVTQPSAQHDECLSRQDKADPENPTGLILDKKLRVEIAIPCGAAEAAGMNGGDRIISADNQPISTPEALQQMLAKHPKRVKLAIVRQFAIQDNDPNMTFTLEPHYGIGHDTRSDRLGIDPGNTGGKLPAATRL